MDPPPELIRIALLVARAAPEIYTRPPELIRIALLVARAAPEIYTRRY